MEDVTTELMAALEDLVRYVKAVGRHQESLKRAERDLTRVLAKMDESAAYVRDLLRDHNEELADSTKSVARMFLNRLEATNVPAVEALAQQTLMTGTAATTGRKHFSPEEAQELVLSVLTEEPQRIGQLMEAIYAKEPSIAPPAVVRALESLREDGKVTAEAVRASMAYHLS